MKSCIVHKLSILFLKYIVVIGGLIMYLHNILLLTNDALLIADWTISLPILPYIVAITWSKAFEFCNIHRAFLTYICIMTYCIKFETVVGFGKLLMPARILMFIFGSILIITLIIHEIKNNKFKIK